MNATERFLRYAAIPTRSDPDSAVTPSTDCQFNLARLLAQELTDLGLTNVRVTDNCFVYAALPATPGLEGQPCLGLIAHMDTAPDYPGEGSSPSCTRTMTAATSCSPPRARCSRRHASPA